MISEDTSLDGKAFVVKTYNDSNDTSIVSLADRPKFSYSIYSPTEFIFITIYCIIFVLGFFPNGLVTYLIFTRKYMRVKYIFTVSIAIAHMLFCVVCIPLILIGASGCFRASTSDIARACQVILVLVVSVTSLSMLATAIRRSLALSERYRYANFTYRGKVKNIIGIWIVSIAICLPFICIEEDYISPFDLTEYSRRNSRNENFARDAMNYSEYNRTVLAPLRLEQQKLSELSFCCSDRNGVLNTRELNVSASYNYSYEKGTIESSILKEAYCFVDMFMYSTCMAVVVIATAVLVSLILQATTLYNIKRRPNQIHWKKETRITKQHLLMLIVLFTCWVPLFVVTIGIRTASCHVTDLQLNMLDLLAASFVTYNPVLYYLLNAHFRREMKLWFRSVNNWIAIVP